MKKAIDDVLGLSFPTKKFKDLLKDTLGDLKYLMDRFQREISGATSIVTDCLRCGLHRKAYHSVDIVIRKQNHLDAYSIIIGYLPHLIANVESFNPKINIPEEHLEAVSSLIFAAPRIKLLSPGCTAIQDVQNILLSHYSQILVLQYLERNNCVINPQLIEKFSNEPSLREVRMKLLKEIAAKENIFLKLKEASTSKKGTQVGSSSKGPGKEKLEQEGIDARSGSEKLVVSGSEEISKFDDEDIEEWMEKDIYIPWSVEGSGDVDHMVDLDEEIAGFKHPLSDRNKRVPEQ